MTTKTPQTGIFNENERHMHFLEYRLSNQDLPLIKQAIRHAQSLDKSEQSEQLTLVISFGKQAWKSLQPNGIPKTLNDFTEIESPSGYVAKATQADVFFWLQGTEIGNVFDAAMHIHGAMKSVAELSLEQQGFDYHHKQDLIGFEDGTANPKTDELKQAAAVIPEGEVGAGGSLVLCQKWVHNLDKWQGVPIHCQEAAVGRTKLDNIELEGDAMPENSHISRTDLKIDGEGMKIYRRSAPFGNVQENGLMFLAFACDLKRFTSQLDSMYGLTKDGLTDQLLNYSKAESGSYFFAPSIEDLNQAIA